MPQTTTTHNPCPECRPVFEGQRSHYCREFLRYQRENFAQRTEINALEVQLKHALEKLLRAERELIQAWKTSQQAEPVAHFGSAYVNENGVHITTVLGPVAIPQDAKLYTTPPQQQAEPVAKLFGSLPVYDTTQETPKCSPA